jgi:hypothetical protein
MIESKLGFMDTIDFVYGIEGQRTGVSVFKSLEDALTISPCALSSGVVEVEIKLLSHASQGSYDPSAIFSEDEVRNKSERFLAWQAKMSERYQEILRWHEEQIKKVQVMLADLALD